jgi:hypothetical protein
MISLLLFISVIVFWIRSYWVADEFMLKRARYDSNAADSERDGGPIWVGTLSEDSILSNRGHIRFYFRHSIDDLELSAVNVKEWSEDNPPGTQFLWSRDDATDGEDHFEFFQVMNQAVYVKSIGVLRGNMPDRRNLAVSAIQRARCHLPHLVRCRSNSPASAAPTRQLLAIQT